jgi:hypothetical protein
MGPTYRGGPVDIAHPDGIAHPGEEHPASPNIRHPCQGRSRLEQLERLKASLKETALMRGAWLARPTMTASGLRSLIMKGSLPARSRGCGGSCRRSASAVHLGCPPGSSASWLRPDKSRHRRPASSSFRTKRVYYRVILRLRLRVPLTRVREFGHSLVQAFVLSEGPDPWTRDGTTLRLGSLYGGPRGRTRGRGPEGAHLQP